MLKNRPMNILYASLIETNAGWGAECFLNDALIATGANTIPIDFMRKQYSLGDRFLQIKDCDIFFLQYGAYFPLPLVEAINRPRFFYCSELVSRFRAADHLFQSDLFDHYFVRGPVCAKELVARGWLAEDKISVHLSAFDAKIYNKVNVEKDIDVLFVGSLLPRREKILERLVTKFRVAVMSAFGSDACLLYNRAKIILNIHAENYLDTETRIYEVLGSGGFLISERLSEENPFVSGELTEVSSIDEMIDSIAYYLDHDNERFAIAEKGYAAAHEKHTYLRRAHELTSLFSKYLAVNKGPALDFKAVRSYARWKYFRRLYAFVKHMKWHAKRRLTSNK